MSFINDQTFQNEPNPTVKPQIQSEEDFMKQKLFLEFQQFLKEKGLPMEGYSLQITNASEALNQTNNNKASTTQTTLTENSEPTSIMQQQHHQIQSQPINDKIEENIENSQIPTQNDPLDKNNQVDNDIRKIVSKDKKIKDRIYKTPESKPRILSKFAPNISKSKGNLLNVDSNDDNVTNITNENKKIHDIQELKRFSEEIDEKLPKKTIQEVPKKNDKIGENIHAIDPKQIKIEDPIVTPKSRIEVCKSPKAATNTNNPIHLYAINMNKKICPERPSAVEQLVPNSVDPIKSKPRKFKISNFIDSDPEESDFDSKETPQNNFIFDFKAAFEKANITNKNPTIASKNNTATIYQKDEIVHKQQQQKSPDDGKNDYKKELQRHSFTGDSQNIVEQILTNEIQNFKQLGQSHAPEANTSNNKKNDNIDFYNSENLVQTIKSIQNNMHDSISPLKDNSNQANPIKAPSLGIDNTSLSDKILIPINSEFDSERAINYHMNKQMADIQSPIYQSQKFIDSTDNQDHSPMEYPFAKDMPNVDLLRVLSSLKKELPKEKQEDINMIQSQFQYQANRNRQLEIEYAYETDKKNHTTSFSSFCFSSHKEDSYYAGVGIPTSIISHDGTFNGNQGLLDYSQISRSTIRVKNDLDFVLLYASPIVNTKSVVGGGIAIAPIVWDIDFVSEIEAVKSTLSEINCDIRFMSSVATQDKIQQIQSKNPVIIHFCGHGIENNRSNFVFGARPGDGDCLQFENGLMQAEYVSCKNLTLQLEDAYKGKRQLEIVFVGSCHSEIIGKVYRNAGARHVVCVKKEYAIADTVCVMFSNFFYTAIFSGKYTICEAFESAKKQIEVQKIWKGEEKKFIMLRHDDEDMWNQHQCSNFHNLCSEKAKFTDLSWKPLFEKVPLRTGPFIGRNVDIHSILIQLTEARLVVINGNIGQGKSYLVKEIANKVLEKCLYKEGVIFNDLREIDSIETAISLINHREKFLSFQKVSENKLENLNIEKMVQKVVENLRDKEVLLIFDNIDSLLLNSSDRFSELLHYLLSNALKIKILVTGFSNFEDVQAKDFLVKMHKIENLNNRESAILLEKKSPRRINNIEVCELFNNTKKGKKIENNKRVLENHPLITELLGGHPQTIVLSATMLEDKSLTELYEFLEKKKDNAGTSISGPNKHLKTAAHTYSTQNIASEILSKLGTQYQKLIGLLSLFPSGATIEDLEQVFEFSNNTYNFNKDKRDFKIEEMVGILIKNSQVNKCSNIINDRKKDFYLVAQIVCNKVSKEINYYEKLNFNDGIINHYVKKFEKLFLFVGGPDQAIGRSANETFSQDFPNIKSCQQRMLKIYAEEQENLKKLEATEAANKKLIQKAKNQKQNVPRDKVKGIRHNLEKKSDIIPTKSPRKPTKFKELSATVPAGTGRPILQPQDLGCPRADSAEDLANIDQAVTNQDNKKADIDNVSQENDMEDNKLQTKSYETNDYGIRLITSSNENINTDTNSNQIESNISSANNLYQDQSPMNNNNKMGVPSPKHNFYKSHKEDLSLAIVDEEKEKIKDSSKDTFFNSKDSFSVLQQQGEGGISRNDSEKINKVLYNDTPIGEAQEFKIQLLNPKSDIISEISEVDSDSSPPSKYDIENPNQLNAPNKKGSQKNQHKSSTGFSRFTKDINQGIQPSITENPKSVDSSEQGSLLQQNFVITNNNSSVITNKGQKSPTTIKSHSLRLEKETSLKDSLNTYNNKTHSKLGGNLSNLDDMIELPVKDEITEKSEDDEDQADDWEEKFITRTPGNLKKANNDNNNEVTLIKQEDSKSSQLKTEENENLDENQMANDEKANLIATEDLLDKMSKTYESNLTILENVGPIIGGVFKHGILASFDGKLDDFVVRSKSKKDLGLKSVNLSDSSVSSVLEDANDIAFNIIKEEEEVNETSSIHMIMTPKTGQITSEYKMNLSHSKNKNNEPLSLPTLAKKYSDIASDRILHGNSKILNRESKKADPLWLINEVSDCKKVSNENDETLEKKVSDSAYKRKQSSNHIRNISNQSNLPPKPPQNEEYNGRPTSGRNETNPRPMSGRTDTNARPTSSRTDSNARPTSGRTNISSNHNSKKILDKVENEKPNDRTNKACNSGNSREKKRPPKDNNDNFALSRKSEGILPLKYGNTQKELLSSTSKAKQITKVVTAPNRQISKKITVMDPTKLSTQSTIQPTTLTINKPTSSNTSSTNKSKNNLSIQKTGTTLLKKAFNNQKTKADKDLTQINEHKLIVLFTSTLFLQARYEECERWIDTFINYSIEKVDIICQANLHKSKACILTHQSKHQESKADNIDQAIAHIEFAHQLFKEVGCMLGIACCLFALGNLKNLRHEFANSRQKLRESLKVYEQLDHVVAQSMICKYLSQIAWKLNLKKEIEDYKEMSKKLMLNNQKRKHTNVNIHKGGKFVLRWIGQRMSLLVEPCFIIDSAPGVTMNKKETLADNNWRIERLKADWVKYNNIKKGRVVELMPSMKKKANSNTIGGKKGEVSKK